MSDTDSRRFRDLGFRCGLEIHQQLQTEKKLFCRCPAGLRPEEPDARIVRHMRPTLSEMGGYDGTALMEFKTRKEVVYELYRAGTCTYEMDDTPPFPLNRQALDIAIEVCLLLNCNIVDEVHVTRKQYLDGSIPTGFQRTAIVGLDGWIEHRGRRIGIAQVTLEEDACREVFDRGHTILFRTDRLSTPLVEVTTCPDMLDPAEAAEVNEELGRILRVTGKVRRGVGSVRQDVNVSISGGTRVEIKGVPSYRRTRELTAIEALRQKALLELRDRVADRDRDGLVGCRADLTDVLAASEAPALVEAREVGWRVGGVCLRGFADVLATVVQPGVTFARELEGRVRVIACLDQPPILLHSADPEGAGLSPRDWDEVRRALEWSGSDDALLIVRGPSADVEMAVEEIATRAGEVWDGVPGETRQALADETTGFERILPGADRMYPDTDTEPVAVSREHVDEVAAGLPEPPAKREARLRKAGVTLQLARRLAASPRYGLALDLLDEGLLRPARTASLLTDVLTGLRRVGVAVDRLSDGRLREALAWAAGNGRPDLAREAIRCAAAGRGWPDLVSDAARERAAVEEALAEASGLGIRGEEPRRRWIIGRARRGLGGPLADGPSLARAAERMLA